MTAEERWVPAGIDTSKANIARVYDYWLGGTHNFLADQDAARVMIAVEPNTRAVARANRACLGRAVRYLAEQAGIGQFLDIGSGIPTAQNVHQVAQQAAPESRVVYADIDPVAVAHSRLLLQDNPGAAVIQADLREPEAILAAPETQLLLDFSQPVAVLLFAVLHFIPDEDDPWQIVATLRDALAPGSYLVLVHGTSESRPDINNAFETAYTSRVAASLFLRLAHPRPPFLRRVRPHRSRPRLPARMAPRPVRRHTRGPAEILGPGWRRPPRVIDVHPGRPGAPRPGRDRGGQGRDGPGRNSLRPRRARNARGEGRLPPGQQCGRRPRHHGGGASGAGRRAGRRG